MDWKWADLPALFGESEIALSRSSGVARSTLQLLTGRYNALLETLIALYRYGQRKPQRLATAFAGVDRPLTLHDLIIIDGIPTPTSPPLRVPLEGTNPAPGVERVWWNLPWLLSQMGASQNGPPLPLYELADLAGISPPNLYKIESGDVLSRVGTLVAIYEVGRARIPDLTLHDVLVIS